MKSVSKKGKENNDAAESEPSESKTRKIIIIKIK